MRTREQITALMQADDTEIVERYRNGASIADVAIAFEISEVQVRRILVDGGVTIRRGNVKAIPQKTAAEVVRLHDVEEMSFTKIAKRLGLKSATAYTVYAREKEMAGA